jgi:phosphomevalonate kinase
MVKKVLEWRAAQPDASGRVWEALNSANRRLERLFAQLRKLASSSITDYGTAVSYRAERTYLQASGPVSSRFVSEVRILFALCHDCFLSVRTLLRELGDGAGVAIEPPSQTKLLDLTMDLPGVLFAGVPGAGGNDAIFAVVLDESLLLHPASEWTPPADHSPAQRVQQLWCSNGVDLLPVIVQTGARGSRGIRVDVTL